MSEIVIMDQRSDKRGVGADCAFQLKGPKCHEMTKPFLTNAITKKDIDLPGVVSSPLERLQFSPGMHFLPTG